MEEKDVSTETQVPLDQNVTLSGEAQSSETTVEDEKPQLAKMVITLEPLAVPEEEDDILAIVHRLPGVEKLWMQIETLTIAHDPDLVTRKDVIRALARRGFRVVKEA